MCAMNGNGTSQYLSLGTATNVTRSVPFTIAALVDSTSLRTSGNWNGVICQGDYNTSGGLSWQVEISAAASPILTFSASQATGASTWSTAQDSTGGPTITANTGWWLVVTCLTHSAGNLLVRYYAYRYSNATLTGPTSGSNITFNSSATQTAPPAAGSTTCVAAEYGTSITDWYPGNFAWAGVWNADLSDAAASNPPRIWELISRGPLALADSNLAGLWILESSSDNHDYSANAHNGTYQNSPTFVGTPVTIWPPLRAWKQSRPPGGNVNALATSGSLTFSASTNLVGNAVLSASGNIVTSGTAAITPANWAATGGPSFDGATFPLKSQGTFALNGGITFTSNTQLTQQMALGSSGGAMSFDGSTITLTSAALLNATSGAIFTGSGTITQTNALATTGGLVFSGTGSLAGNAHNEIGVNNAGNGANDCSPAIARDSTGTLWRAAFTAAAFTNSGGANNGNTLRMFKADQSGSPTTFSEKDSAHRPTSIGSFSMAIDSADLIHIAYVHTYDASTTGCYYNTFDTTNNLWGSEVKIGTINYASQSTYVVGDAGVCLALDSNGKPHVVHYGQTSGTGATHIFYTNKTSGSWSAALQLDTQSLNTNQRCMHPQCMFDSNGVLHVVWMTITANYGTTDERCYYINRSSGGTWSSVTQFSDRLLGSIDNGPGIYVSEDNAIHIAYGLGDGTNPVGETVTGTTTNNKVYYRKSTDGGSTWDTSSQPAHYVSHDFNPGPDGFGGIRIWSHTQPSTVDGLGLGIGYIALPKGGSWAAWTQVAVDNNGNGYDCTVSPRKATFINPWHGYIDEAYFDLNLPLSAMMASDPGGNALAGTTASVAMGFSCTATLSPMSLVIPGTLTFTASAAMQPVAALATAASWSLSGVAALTAQNLAASGSLAFSGSVAVTPQNMQTTGGAVFGGSAVLATSVASLTTTGGATFTGSAALFIDTGVTNPPTPGNLTGTIILRDGATGTVRLRDGATGTVARRDGATGSVVLRDGVSGTVRLRDGASGTIIV